MSERNTNRHLLLISYYFAPTPSVGSVRAGGIAKFLPQFGWRVTVVTPGRPERTLHNSSIRETGDASLAANVKGWLGLSSDTALKDAWAASTRDARARLRARTIDFVKGVIAVPDTHSGWVRHAATTARAVFRDDPFDAVLSTSPPVSAHLAGRAVAKSCGVPWVADLRDLWSNDRNSTAPRWRRSIDRRIERHTLRDSSALVTVSEPLARELRALHPSLPVHSILNGFDPDKRALAEGLTADFTLTHTGTFYQGRRDPTLLFEALAHLFATEALPRRQVRVRFFARHEPWVSTLAERYQLLDVVSVLPWGGWEDALRAQQESQALLLFHWGSEPEAGVYTGKVFEYLAARRPILLIGGPKGVLTDLLDETLAGIHVRSGEELQTCLRQAFEEFRRTGAVSYRGDPKRIEKYSQVRMAEEFSHIFGSLTATAGTPARAHVRH